MDNSEFKVKALRTESKDFSVIQERLEDPAIAALVILELQNTVAQLQKLDAIKKFVYYGRNNSFIEYWLQKDWPVKKSVMPVNNLHGVLGQANALSKVPSNIRLLHGVMGICTEGGELVEALLKVSRGEYVDRVNFMEEVGDTNWYEAIIADTLLFEVDEANERVISKLQKRFPEKFSEEKAINRDLNVERKVLEGKVSEIEEVKDIAQLEELMKGNNVVLKFWAEWCGPCKAYKPVINELASEHPSIKFLAVNVDNHPQLANKYGIRGIPTVMLFQGGESKRTMVGNQPKSEVLKEINLAFQ